MCVFCVLGSHDSHVNYSLLGCTVFVVFLYIEMYIGCFYSFCGFTSYSHKMYLYMILINRLITRFTCSCMILFKV